MGFYTVGQCVSSMFCSAHMTSFVILDQNVQIVFLCSISDLSFSYKRRKSKIKKNLYCCLALAVMGHCEDLCKDLFCYKTVGLLQYFEYKIYSILLVLYRHFYGF